MYNNLSQQCLFMQYCKHSIAYCKEFINDIITYKHVRIYCFVLPFFIFFLLLK